MKVTHFLSRACGCTQQSNWSRMSETSTVTNRHILSLLSSCPRPTLAPWRTCQLQRKWLASTPRRLPQLQLEVVGVHPSTSGSVRGPAPLKQKWRWLASTAQCLVVRHTWSDPRQWKWLASTPQNNKWWFSYMLNPLSGAATLSRRLHSSSQHTCNTSENVVKHSANKILPFVA